MPQRGMAARSLATTYARLMWRWLGMVVLGCGCRPSGTPTEPTPPPAVVETEPDPTTEPEPEAETPPEPAPPPLAFVVDGWVRDTSTPAAPLLRLTKLRPSEHDDPRPVTALLALLDPLMTCYEDALHDDPELRATVWIFRRPPEADDAEGIEVRVEEPHPTALLACVEPLVRAGLPAQADDPYGRYAVSLFPHRDQAPRLREPQPDDEVVEREGGSCWTKRDYPCKPHKVCKASTWERTHCPAPADHP